MARRVNDRGIEPKGSYSLSAQSTCTRQRCSAGPPYASVRVKGAEPVAAPIPGRIERCHDNAVAEFQFAVDCERVEEPVSHSLPFIGMTTCIAVRLAIAVATAP